MDEEFQALLDAHPGWSKEVRASIAALGEGMLRESASVVRLDVTQAAETDTPPRNAGVSLGTEPHRPLQRERWLTRWELAMALDASERTVKRWMKDGLPFGGRPGGGAVRFRLSEVLAWRSEREGRDRPATRQCT